MNKRYKYLHHCKNYLHSECITPWKLLHKVQIGSFLGLFFLNACKWLCDNMVMWNSFCLHQCCGHIELLHLWQTLWNSIPVAGLVHHQLLMKYMLNKATFYPQGVYNILIHDYGNSLINNMDVLCQASDRVERESRKVWVNMQKLVLLSIQAMPSCSCYCTDFVTPVKSIAWKIFTKQWWVENFSPNICLHNDFHQCGYSTTCYCGPLYLQMMKQTHT